jgi:hypothetical protein
VERRFWRRHFADPVRQWLGREAYALPVDLFRVAVGLLAVFYFARLIHEVPDFSDPNGLIDHALLQEVYWFTRISLFQAGTPVGVIYMALALGLVGAVSIVAGYRVKICAAALLVIAASTYRWNFLVMYLDDGIMHLMLFWLLLLPVGRTLILAELIQRPRTALAAWSRVVVPGAAVWCLLLNLCLIYFLAGAWKLNSILWHDGFGLYAALRLPIARMADVWGPQHLPLLRIANYAAVVLEAVFPLALMLRPRHPVKRVAAVLFAGFHLSIFVTIGIPVASLGLIATLALFFHREIAEMVARRDAGRPLPALGRSPRVPRAGWAGFAFVVTLTMATTRSVPFFGALNEPAYASLWMVGVAQDYRLFNWIDKVNYHVETEVIVQHPDGRFERRDPSDVYPASMRSGLLQAYAHDIRWMAFPRPYRRQIRESIVDRLAHRFCRRHDIDGTVSIGSRVHRITPDNLDFSRGERILLVEFTCDSETAIVSRRLRRRKLGPPAYDRTLTLERSGGKKS